MAAMLLPRQPLRNITAGTDAATHVSVHSRTGCQIRTLRVTAAVASSPEGLRGTLKYNRLGKSDLLISEITLGTMTFGNQNSEREAHEQLSYAFDKGINILDTAEIYPVPVDESYVGRTDECIGTWLKTQRRDQVIVATKLVGFSMSSMHRSWGAPTRVDARNVKEAVEGHLRRLQTDYVDLLQIHWPDRYVPLFGAYLYEEGEERESVPFEEQLRALEAVIKEGKVRYIGVSNETSWGVTEFIRLSEALGLPRIVSLQNAYSLICRTRFETDLHEVCRRTNVGLLAYSPLAGGALSGKYRNMDSDAARAGRLSIFPGYMGRFLRTLSKEACTEYAELAEANGMSPAQLSLAFVRDRTFITSTIIGATTMEQLKDNLCAWTLPRPLPLEVTDKIEEIFRRYRDPSLLESIVNRTHSTKT